MLKPQFIEMLTTIASLPGGEAVSGLADALATTQPSVGVRVNPLKGILRPDDKQPVAWCDDGFYVEGERPRFTFDPALHQGLYYVQDPSSMAIESVIKELTKLTEQPLVYIDACAAPGGKTTAAIAALPEGSLVIANEYESRRVGILCENLMKWGAPGIVVTTGDTSRFRKLGEIADIVAVDAPCSGEGMMRKDEDAVNQWSTALVESCAALQREILDNMWQTLRPGGYMIYSTCTFNTSEDEDNLRYIVDELGGEPIELPLPYDAGICRAIGSELPAARFIPGRIDGEGLFMAVVRKPGTFMATEQKRNPHVGKSTTLLSLAVSWIKNTEMILKQERDTIMAFPAHWESLLTALRSKLKVVMAGVEVANIKGRDLIPTQQLALSTLLKRDAFPTAEVDYSTAISYLRREAIALADSPRGIVLLTFRGHPLGFVKNLGNRANNLLPQHWAIKSSYIPDQPPSIIG